MNPNRISRRLLLAGGVAAGSGLVGAAWALDADEGVGAPGGVTAGAIPEGSDPLVWLDADALDDGVERAVADALLRSPQFAAVPVPLRDRAVGERGDDPGRLGELVAVGTGPDHSAAVAWTNWSDERVTGLLGPPEAVRSERYGGQTLYTDGETSAFPFSDGDFVVGSSPAVRRFADRRNGAVGRLDGDTLDAFVPTPRGSVRFSADASALPCADATSDRAAAYDRVARVAGGTFASNAGLRLDLRAGSRDAAADVASAARADFGEAGDGNGTPGAFPAAARERVTVDRERSLVTITYDGAADDSGDGARALVRAVSCLVAPDG